jgi:hypothetical protein
MTLAPVLDICGGVLLVVGSWRGYALARRAVAPFVHDDEPRGGSGAASPSATEPRGRLFATRVTLAVAWLAVAFYGLFLLAAAQSSPA